MPHIALRMARLDHDVFAGLALEYAIEFDEFCSELASRQVSERLTTRHSDLRVSDYTAIWRFISAIMHQSEGAIRYR